MHEHVAVLCAPYYLLRVDRKLQNVLMAAVAMFLSSSPLQDVSAATAMLPQRLACTSCLRALAIPIHVHDIHTMLTLLLPSGARRAAD